MRRSKLRLNKDVEIQMDPGFVDWFNVFPRYSEKFVLKKWKVGTLETFLQTFRFGWGSLDERYWFGLSRRDFLMSWLRFYTEGSTERVFSRMWSRSASPSAKVLWSGDSPVMISSYRADSLLRLDQKCYNNTWSGIDKAGLECVKIENLAQASPMVSLSCWRELRIPHRREAIWDIGKNAE